MVESVAKFVICPHEEAGEVCGFEVRSEDEDEVVRRVQQHAEQAHDLTFTRADVEELMDDT